MVALSFAGLGRLDPETRKESLLMTRSMEPNLQKLIALGVIAFFCQPAQAQDSASENNEAQEGEATSAESHQSGYEDIAEFGGPDSVGNELKSNDAAR